jgi:hypothetical protein
VDTLEPIRRIRPLPGESIGLQSLSARNLQFLAICSSLVRSLILFAAEANMKFSMTTAQRTLQHLWKGLFQEWLFGQQTSTLLRPRWPFTASTGKLSHDGTTQDFQWMRE